MFGQSAWECWLSVGQLCVLLFGMARHSAYGIYSALSKFVELHVSSSSNASRICNFWSSKSVICKQFLLLLSWVPKFIMLRGGSEFARLIRTTQKMCYDDDDLLACLFLIIIILWEFLLLVD